MAEIVLEGVTKRYAAGPPAVAAMDLSIAHGEFIVLVGPSGCGKSTTLNMIAGLEEITSGELRIDGKVVTHKPPRERDIAMVFQSYALYPHLTVRENMAFPLKLAKLDRASIERKVNDAAEILHLTEYLERKPGQLSGGQRQRVAMGRAIVRAPKAFLMDEPLSNLDAKLRVQMRTQLARLQKRLATTTIYVTHDQVEAMTLGDRLVIMHRGVVQQIGSPQEVYQRPANLFVAGFVGSPAMNLFAATLEDDCLRSALGDIPLDARLRAALARHAGARELIVGIRPEHLQDATLHSTRAKPVFSFERTVEVVESVGSDVYAYFRAERGGISRVDLNLRAQGIEADASTDLDLVARLDPETRARRGEALKLVFSPEKVALFDAQSGENLVR